MKKLTNLIKSADPKKMIVLGVSTAVGAANGVVTVAKKRSEELSNSDAKKTVEKVLNKTLSAGSKVVTGIREDLSIVVGSAKSQSCAASCAHCEYKDTYKPCCKDGKACKVENVAEEAAAEEVVPEPVKAEEVVTEKTEEDSLAETLKNDVLKAEKRAALADAKKETVRKPRAPRVAKDKTFATEIREVLQEKPDEIIVGEIRDEKANDEMKTEKED